MKISEFSECDRPREKLMERGASALTDAELLAVLLRSGMVGAGALDVARSLLDLCGGDLCALASMSVAEMCAVPGIGKGKAMSIVSSLELGRRQVVSQDRREVVKISAPEDACRLLRHQYQGVTREQCCCMFLRRDRSIISIEKISDGGEAFTELDIKGIVRRALACRAVYLLLCHNHPSGDPTPSTADVRLTAQLKKALSTFELTLLDHIIIAAGSCWSFCEEGKV